MNTLAATTPDEDIPRARVALLLKHFSVIKDDREPWRVVYPLREVLLLVVCGTIASCDDFDDIVAWGEDHIDFLRRFCEFHHGIPCERWVRTLFNRVDPVLFSRCFKSWVAALWPDRHEFIAIDGKTSRRTHDERKGLKALHTLSAYATNARLTLAQLGVPEKTNEITAIPEILDELAEHKQLKGAMVTIDAMGCQVAIADKIVAHEADYLLALKGNQPTLETDVKDYFRTAPDDEVVAKPPVVEKGHGRIETRAYTASSNVDWISSERSYPGQPRFNNIKTILKVYSRVEYHDRCSFETRYYISSAKLEIERLANPRSREVGRLGNKWVERENFGSSRPMAVRRFARRSPWLLGLYAYAQGPKEYFARSDWRIDPK